MSETRLDVIGVAVLGGLALCLLVAFAALTFCVGSKVGWW